MTNSVAPDQTAPEYQSTLIAEASVRIFIVKMEYISQIEFKQE